jgi:uncharacterized protein (TIGR00730 family)
MLTTILKMAGEGTDRWELKIASSTLKDLRAGYKVFRDHKRRRKATIYGSARTTVEHPLYEMARTTAEQLVAAGFMVMTGAGPGIMQAGHEGAGAKQSFGLNIRLPFEQSANAVIAKDPKLIAFRYFFTRKLFFVKEADALVLFPGGFGTMDETFELLTLVQTGRSPVVPIVLLDLPGDTYWEGFEQFLRRELLGSGRIAERDLSLYRRFHDPADAVAEISRFYTRYHSSRYLGPELRLRIHGTLTEEQMSLMNEEFSALLLSGAITQQGPSDDERRDEPGLDDLSRLCLVFNQRDHGLLRLLIDRINGLTTERRAQPEPDRRIP